MYLAVQLTRCLRQLGGAGNFGSVPWTARELYLITNNPEWYAKAVFYMTGEALLKSTFASSCSRRLMTDHTSKVMDIISGLQGYKYRFWAYQAGHSILTIRAYNPSFPGHNLHINFEPVFYVQIPNTWESDGFQLSTTEEFENVIYKIEFDEIRAKNMKLFTTDTERMKIYILAHSVSLEYDVPPLYRVCFLL